MIEIKAIYRGERYRFDSFNEGGLQVIIGEAQIIDRGASSGVSIQNGDTVGIKGEVDHDGLADGQTYRLSGRWTEYKNKRKGTTEQQFAFGSYVLDEPVGRDAVVGYIEQAGKGNGIGRAMADRIWSAWGEDSIAILRDDPDRLSDVLPSLSAEKRQKISDWLRERQSTERTSMELQQLLKGRGFPKSLARAAIREWGAKAVQVIVRDPFVLLRKFSGCGYARCDALYNAMRLEPGRLRRQMYCAWHAVASDNGGNTWVKADVAVSALNGCGAEPRPLQALRLARRVHDWLPGRPGGLAVARTGSDGELVAEGKGDQVWLSVSANATAETDLAEYVVEALSECKPLTVTEWDKVGEVVEDTPRSARCARCGRLLTSEVIHVVDGLAYGPTCVEYVA